MNINQSLKPGGVFVLEHFRDGVKIGEDIIENLVTDEGKDYMANIAYNNADSIKPSWYLALYKNNLSPVAGDTAAAVAARLGELNAELDPAVNPNRPQWVKNTTVPNTGLLSSNSENPALFKMSADVTIYGAYIISSSTKAGTTGVLLAATKFVPSRSVFSGDELTLKYSIALT